MKKVVKLFGIIALVAIIGFSMAACKDDDDTPVVVTGSAFPAAPTGLTATAVSTTEIRLSWNAVSGASGYIVYASYNSSSGFYSMDTVYTTSDIASNGTPGTTYYFKVAAFNASGTEGTMSNFVSATTLTAVNTSLNGTWVALSDGWEVTVNGSTGVISKIGWVDWGDQNAERFKDAINKGYIKVGTPNWRNITSTGNLRWSGETLAVSFYTSNPTVATGITYVPCTFVMSADGQKLGGSDNNWTHTRK